MIQIPGILYIVSITEWSLMETDLTETNTIAPEQDKANRKKEAQGKTQETDIDAETHSGIP